MPMTHWAPNRSLTASGGKEPPLEMGWSNPAVSKGMLGGGDEKHHRGRFRLKPLIRSRCLSQLFRLSEEFRATLLALRRLCLGGRGRRSRFLLGGARLLFPQFFFLLTQLIGLSIGHVAELLHPPRVHLRRENAVLWIDRNAHQPLELPGKQA